MTPYEHYMEKQALNALTKRIQWNSGGLRLGKDTLSEIQHEMHLNGREIGHIQIDRRKTPINPLDRSTWFKGQGPASETASVGFSEVDDKFRGLGLGRKLYGRAMHHEYAEGRNNFTGDWKGLVSDEANHLWESLQRRGLPVTKTPPPGAKATDPNKGQQHSWHMDLDERFSNPSIHPASGPRDVLAATRQGKERRSIGQTNYNL